MDPNFKNPAIFSETNEPSTPSSGTLAVYAATDGTLRTKNDGGVVVNIGSAATAAAGTFTTVNSNSARWSSSYTTTNANSANWSSVYSSFNAQSANNASVFTTVNANSAAWDAAAGGGLTQAQVFTRVFFKI